MFAGTIRRNEHRDGLALGQFQIPLAQNDVRAGEPNRRWEVRSNKWKGQRAGGAKSVFHFDVPGSVRTAVTN